jgi:hypothetical protein
MVPRASISAEMPVGVARQPFLDRAQPCLRQMLWRAPCAEPRIGRGIEQEIGAVCTIDDLA